MKVYDALVVGSGVSGLTCATFLERRKKSVKVITRDVVAGGKTHTIEHGGRTHHGARVYFFRDYHLLTWLARKHGIRMERLTRFDNAVEEGGRVVYRTNREVMSGERNLRTPLQAARYLWHRHRLLKAHASGRPDRETLAQLARPFARWVQEHGYTFLWYPATRAYQNVGFGHLDEEPALYVMRMMSWGVLYSALRGYVRIFPDDVSALFRAMAAGLDIDYNTSFAKMEKGADGVWFVRTDRETYCTRTVVFCCSPLLLDFTPYWGTAAATIFTRENVRAQTFGTAMYEVDGWFDVQSRGFLHNTGEKAAMLSAARSGTLPSGRECYTTFFYTGDEARFGDRLTYRRDRPEMVTRIAADITRDGGTNVTPFYYREWPEFFTRFTADAVAAGQSVALERLNGTNNVWYIGSLIALESCRELSRYARWIAGRI
jgi:glycine/D-amino acid oxidase-like deaminating enzyme